MVVFFYAASVGLLGKYVMKNTVGTVLFEREGKRSQGRGKYLMYYMSFPKKN